MFPSLGDWKRKKKETIAQLKEHGIKGGHLVDRTDQWEKGKPDDKGNFTKS